MPDIETLNHTKWDCKYHVVFGSVLDVEMD